eukprot:3612468-Pyramimonas_sp.AAC.1
MACHVYVYDTCAAICGRAYHVGASMCHVYDACEDVSGRVSHVGAQYVAHTSWVCDAVNTPGVHWRC